MRYVMPYIEAIRDLKKKYYLMPFLLFMYVFLFIQISGSVTRFAEMHNKEAMDFVRFTVTFIYAYGLYFIQALCYPHASLFVQRTFLYQKVFGTMRGVIGSRWTRYFRIGSDIPDDVVVHGRNGGRYIVSAGYKTKTSRVHNARTNYLLYIYFMFFLKDIALRLFLHMGIFIVSPLLFLIAVPALEKKGVLSDIEK